MDQKELEQIYQYVKRRLIEDQQKMQLRRVWIEEQVDKEALEAAYGPHGQG